MVIKAPQSLCLSSCLILQKSAKFKAMRALHFFKAKSRMGIANHHRSLGEHDDIGVENGPDSLLTYDFLARFPLSYVSEYVFPKPEEVRREQFDEILGRQTIYFKDFINKNLKPGQTQVVVGGDHFVTLPSVLALRERIGSFKNLGYVQFDSHGDINLRASSPTGNFHGMYVRTLVDRLDIPEVEKLISDKLPVDNIMYIGNLNLDKGEVDLFKKKKIQNISREELLGNKRNVIKNFQDFVSAFKHLHLTFDIDVLNKVQAPATGIPSEDGPMFEDIEEMLNIIGKHPNLSLDLTEVNPKKSGIEQTVKSAHKVLLAVLSG